jgi:thiol-disulfide isomerase/thioredoxin
MPANSGIPLVPCCPESGGGDLVALLAVAGLALVAHGLVKWFRNRKGNTPMKNWKHGLIAGTLLLATAGYLIAQQQDTAPAAAANAPAAAIEAGLPTLLELGADRCIPCQQMKPIIDSLKATYEGQLHVDFIDVWKNPEEGKKYGVRVIPLQIFFDAEGQELFRHEGFFSKEDILAKWTELGVELTAP